MNTLLNGLKDNFNYTHTENGAITHKTTKSALLDMFGMGGSMRNRSDDDVILMFKNAYEENPEYALKCLFYLRDCRGGAGERRFFRIVIKWLARENKDAVIRNMKFIPEMGRWDDLYSLVDTPVEKEMFEFICKQLILDVECNTPSLLAKWCKSENTSSYESRRLGQKTREALDLTPRAYRKMLSLLRNRINIVETLMSQNRWDEIKFDKIPSRAGLIYKNAFAKRDIIKEQYKAFMSDKTTKVNAKVLNPVDIANQIFSNSWRTTEIERLTWQKYWDNLEDYYAGREEPGIAIVDVSGSMYGQPLNAAVSMGAYIAERGKGPFHNHFITFSDNPELVEFKGIDIYDKFWRARNANWNNSTNIESVFDLLLHTAIQKKVKPEDMPKTLYIFSDMEFNHTLTSNEWAYDMWGRRIRKPLSTTDNINTLIEAQMKKWKAHGYTTPRIIFWNLDARHENIPAIGDKFSYVSGFSMNMVKTILSGKDGMALMFEKLNEPRYANIK